MWERKDMANSKKISKREQNKKINKYLPGLIKEATQTNRQFAKNKKALSMILWIWIATRILLVVDEFFMLAELGEGSSAISTDIATLVVIFAFAETFKRGNRILAVLPLLGVGVSIVSAGGVESFITMLESGYTNFIIFAVLLIVNLAWQTLAMLYVLLSPSSKTYQNQVNQLIETAKNMEVAA